MNIEDIDRVDLSNLNIADKWILTKLNDTVKSVSKAMDKYDFNNVGNNLYSFIWNDFCDKYIELSKFNKNNTTKSVLLVVLTDILKMLHPFMPFVTEEIYGMLPIKNKESIMLESYPVYNKKYIYREGEKLLDDTLELVTRFRNKKLELNIGNLFGVKLKIDNEDVRNLVINLLKLQDKLIVSIDGTLEKIKIGDLELDIIYDNSKNLEKERELLLKEKKILENSIVRRESLLSNENYLEKAPAAVVANERLALDKEKTQLEIIKNKIGEV